MKILVLDDIESGFVEDALKQKIGAMKLLGSRMGPDAPIKDQVQDLEALLRKIAAADTEFVLPAKTIITVPR